MKTKAKPARKPAAVQDTFTVRDMNRRPQVVLSAARKLGRVRVQSRSGERFLIAPEPVEASGASTRAHFLTRLRKLQAEMAAKGSTGFTREGWETFSKAIAGE